MHHRIYDAFEEVCRTRRVCGAVLEVGAMPHAGTLLCLEALGEATEKVGINLEGPARFRDFDILKGNANEMPFEDDRFDAVISNATLEHDAFFWKTLSEIRRVARPGALVVLGVPGYTSSVCSRARASFSRLPLIRRLMGLGIFDALFNSTVTYRVHNDPGDYYRFGQQAVEQVLLQDMVDKEVRRVMTPPRLIGSARMPSSV